MLVGLEMIEETIKIVDLNTKRIKEANYCQKSYANLHQRTLEFEVGDHIFLKCH